MTEVYHWISDHLRLMNVTGAETGLSNRLQEEFASEGILPKTDDLGCLYVPGKKNDLLFTAMMDVPGYLLLQKYPKKSILISTLATPEDRGTQFTAIDPEGKTVSVRRKDEAGALYYIQKKEYKIGSVFKEKTEISEKDGVLHGRDLTRYVLLYCLKKLAETDHSCLFASQGYSNAPTEYNFAMRNGTKRMIFLGAVESKEDKPLVLIRNGKHFSDPALIESAEKAGFVPYLSEFAVTKSQACADSGAKVVTLALPYRLTKEGERQVNCETVNLFLKMLRKIK